jgi:hypothetical protein
MGTSLGSVYVDLGLDSSGFSAGLTGAQGDLQSFGSAARTSLAGSAASFAPLTRAAGVSRIELFELGHSARATFDILAAGGSPMRALALEGARVVQALAEGPGGIGGALAAVGDTVAALATPMNLALAALAALGVGAVLWLTHEHDKAVDATAALEAHKKWLDQILDGYADAKKAADEYLAAASQLPEAAVGSDLKSHQTGASDNLKAALAELQQYRDELNTDLTQPIEQFGSQAAADSVARLLDVVKQAGLSATSTKAQFDALVSSLTEIKNSGPPTEAFLAGRMLDLATNAEKAASAVTSIDVALNALPSSVAVQIEVQMKGFTEARTKLLGLIPDTRDQFTRARDDAKAAHSQELGAAPDGIMRQAADADYSRVMAGIDAAQKAVEDKKANGNAESAAVRQQKQIDNVTTSLQRQIAALTETGKQQAEANALAQAGITADAKQAAGIITLADKLYDAKQAQQQLNAAVANFQDMEKSALSTFISDLRQGKTAAEALGDTIGGIGNRLIDLGINALVGSQTSGLQGLLGSVLHLSLPGRASGGPVTAGQAYVVGEKRPELFVPSTSGTIVPNLAGLSHANSNGGTHVTYAPQIDARGADTAAVVKLGEVMARDRAEFESRVIGTIRTAKHRRQL